MSVYAFDAAANAYLSHDGAGTVKSLTLAGTTWTWRENAKNAYGRFETYDQANGGRILAAGDQSGVRLNYQYGTNGSLAKVTSVKSGESTNFQYDANGNLASIDVAAKDSANVLKTYTRVRYGYDTLGRLATVTTDLTPDDGVFGTDTYTTRYSYDGTSSRIASVTQDDGSKLVIGYQGFPAGTPTEWKVSTLTDALGRTTTFTYGTGVTTVTDALNNQTTYRYDDAGRLTEVQGADVNGAAAGGVQRTLYSYDGNGNIATIGDGQGHVTTYSYDAQDNCILQRDQSGNTLSRTFDAAGNLLTETNYLQPDTGAGTAALPAVTTRYIYDSSNRLHFKISAEGRVTEYKYEIAGEKELLSAMLQYNGPLYDVDAFTTTAVPTDTQMVTWAASSSVRLKASRIDYNYDARGLLSTTKTYESISSYQTGSGAESTTSYVYDRAGQLIKKIDPNGNPTSYAYDGLGRLIATTDALNNVTASTFTYGTAGVTTTTQLYTGAVAGAVKAGAATTTTVDLGGQTVATGAAGALLKYSYDAAGRLRMSENAVGQRQYWLYDAAGRKVATVDSTGALTESTYNDANQLLRTVTYATRIAVATLLDAAGKPANVALATLRPAASAQDRTTWNFYDGAGRLTDQVDPEGYLTRQVYDGASRIVQSTRFAKPVSLATLATTTPVPVASADDRVTRVFYDDDGYVTGKLDADGYLTENKYDAAGRLVESVAYATATQASLRAAGTLGALRPAASADDISQRNVYNNRNQLIHTVDGDNFLTAITYDLAGNVTQRIRYASALAAGADPATAAPGITVNDSKTTYVYTKANRVWRETATDGTITQYGYDTAGNVTLIQRAYGVVDEARDNAVRYDAYGRVEAELSAEGTALLAALPAGTTVDDVWSKYATRYTYNAAGLRTSATDQNGRTAWYYYDANGRLAASVNATGEVQRRTYDVFGQLTVATLHARRLDMATAGLTGGALTAAITAKFDALAGTADTVQRYSYDRKGRVIDQTDALGYHTLSTYDAFDDVLTSARQNTAKTGYITTGYQYDRRGNMVQSNPFQNVALATRVQYDGFGRAITRTDANGNATTLGYDHLGHVVALKTPGAPAALTTYDAFGRTLTQTDSLGNRTIYLYNAAARSMSITTAGGVQHTTVQNRHGQTVSVADSMGTTTTYAYDRNGNLTTVSDSLGVRQANTYDRAGLQLTSKDANGIVTALSYDAASRVLTRTVDPTGLNLTTTYSYDTAGRTLSVQDPQGGITRTTYDQAGHVKSIAAPDGATTLLNYDSRGNVLTQTAPDGVVTTYQYDENGYSSYSIVDGERTDVVYDKTGKNLLLRATNQQQSTRYAYDANNRLTWEIDPTGAVTGYTYDAAGRLTQTTHYANRSSLVTATTAWNATFDATTIAASVVADASRDATTRVFYDKDGRLYGTVDATGSVSVVAAYDVENRPTQRISYAKPMTLAANATTDTLRTAVATSLPVDTAKNTLIVYDARGQITATATAAGVNADTGLQQWAVQSFAYDGNGNVTASTTYTTMWESASPVISVLKTWLATAANSKASDKSVVMTYDSANRLTGTATAQGGIGADRTWSVSTQRYDKAGNVIEQRTAATLLTGAAPTAAQIAAVAAAPTDSITRYQYDKRGRLLASAVAQGPDASGKQRWAIAQRELNSMGLVVRAVQYATLYTGDVPADIVSAAATLATAADRITRHAYNHAGQLLVTVDAEGSVTQRLYDTRGNAVQRIEYGKLALITDMSKWELAKTSATEPARITRTVYDLADRPVMQVDALGNVTETVYDALGNAIGVTAYAAPVSMGTLKELGPAPDAAKIRALLKPDAQKDRTTRFVYDGDGRVRFTVDPAGYITENRYDALGRVTMNLAYPIAKPLTDAGLAAGVAAEAGAQGAMARKTSYTYDQRGNVLTSTDATGAVQKYTYDGAGRKLTYADQLNNLWTYAYDATGRLVTETSPKVMAFSNVLNASFGNWGSNIQQALVTRYVYDALGNLTKKTEAAGTALERSTLFEYDLAGRRVKTTQPSVRVYDAVNDPLTSAGGVTAIEKDSGPRTVTVTYDAFGNAVASKDVGGIISYRVFDKLGRVTADIDALGYVTSYQLNGFGETQKLTRHATSLGAVTAPLTQAVLAARLVKSSTADRTIVTEYDQLGRAVRVREPVVEVYDPNATGGVALIHAGKTTATRYDAFGQVLQREVYGADRAGTKVADGSLTRFYYDLRGQVSAQVEALSAKAGALRGYLTTFTYDAAGNTLTKTEYNNAIANWNDSVYESPVANAALDRRWSYTYDARNRKLSETSLGVTYSDNTSAAAVVTGNLTTTYAYNARGERTTVTDALNGTTYTYYDALGRVTGNAAIVTANVTGITRAGWRVTEMKRDLFGNVVLNIEYAQDNISISVYGVVAPIVVDANTRVTATVYNSDGMAVQVVDAEQFAKPPGSRSASNISYDAYGRAVKQWRSVTNGSSVQTTYQVVRYDALGRKIDTVTPNDRVAGTAALQDHVTYEYNSFGEVTKTSLGDYYRYDQAGNVWLSNEGGADQAMLHDVMGRVTVAIRSRDEDDVHVLQKLASGAEALALEQVLRTDTRYDMLGHKTDVTESASNHAGLMNPNGSEWIKTTDAGEIQGIGNTVALNTVSAGNLLIIGRPEDTNKTFTVRYRRTADTAWTEAPPSSIRWAEGYPTFSTAGLTGGDYVYQITEQPAGETAYTSAVGTFVITDRNAMLARATQIIGLYLLVVNRAPTQAELNEALVSLDNDYDVMVSMEGRTLSQLATALLASAEGQAFLTGANAVARIYSEVLHKDMTVPAIATEAAARSRELDLGNRSAWFNGEALVSLFNANSAILSRRTAALLNYLVVAGGSDTTVSARLILDADQLADGAIAEGTAAAALERQRDDVMTVYLYATEKIPSKSQFEGWITALRAGTTTLKAIAQSLGVGPLLPNILASTTYVGALEAMTNKRLSLYNRSKLAQAYLALPSYTEDPAAIDIANQLIKRVWRQASPRLAAGPVAANLQKQLSYIQQALTALAAPAGSVGRTNAVRFYATQLALRGNVTASDILAGGFAAISGDSLVMADAMLDAPSDAPMRLSARRGATARDYVGTLYAAFDWPVTAAEIDARVAQLAAGATRAEVLDRIVTEVIDYVGTDPARVAARQNVLGTLNALVAIEQQTLTQLSKDTTPIAQLANTLAALDLKSADILLLPADTVSVQASIQQAAQPKITVDRWGNVLSMTDARDANWKVTYTYNYRNELIDQTANTLTGQAASFHTQMKYDALGRLVASVDANGNVNRRGYDSNGNVVTETHADGGIVTSTYNLFGERLSVKQPDMAAAGSGVQRNYAYDHLGNLVQTWTVGSVDFYAATGQATLTATSMGSKQLSDQFTYDELGRRIASKDANGVVTKQFYNLNGDVTKTVDGMGYETVSTYDAMHRLVKQVDANGREKSWVFDTAGQLTESRDMAGNITRYRYNGAGQLVQQTSTRGQDIRYTYDGSAVTRIWDDGTGLTTEYSYDAAGNRLTEKQSYDAWVAVTPGRLQNNRLTYDMQNRLLSVKDDQYTLTYAYDGNGNRTLLRTQYDTTVFDAYNTYDSMNRQLIVNGEKDSSGNIVFGRYGHKITYDKAGNRLTDTFLGVQITQTDPTTYATTANQTTVESYTYDAVGRLATVKRDALTVDTRHYDAAGRVVESGFLGMAANTSITAAAAAIGMSAETKTSVFDASGRTIRQMSKALGGVGLVDITYGGTAGTGYDKVGNLLGYTVLNMMAGKTDQYTFDYEVRGSYAEKNIRLNNSSSTANAYDVNGRRVAMTKQNIETGKTSTTSYWYDADGHIQSRKQDEETTFSLIVNGNVLGTETKTRDNFIGQNYVAATAAAYLSAPTVYTTQAGDTLKNIAQRIWGDASLWYLIADLNGLDGSTVLSAGRALKIPPRINTVYNGAATYQPYDEGAALGNTSPLGAPSSDNCGAMGDIVSTTIAIAATYITSGRLNIEAMDYLADALGGQDDAARAMSTADPIAQAVVKNLFQISSDLSGQIASDFLTKVLQDGNVNSVQAAFNSYIKGSNWQATSVRSLLFQGAANGAHVLSGLRTAFNWTDTTAHVVSVTTSGSAPRSMMARAFFGGEDMPMAWGYEADDDGGDEDWGGGGDDGGWDGGWDGGGGEGGGGDGGGGGGGGDGGGGDGGGDWGDGGGGGDWGDSGDGGNDGGSSDNGGNEPSIGGYDGGPAGDPDMPRVPVPGTREPTPGPNTPNVGDLIGVPSTGTGRVDVITGNGIADAVDRYKDQLDRQDPRDPGPGEGGQGSGPSTPSVPVPPAPVPPPPAPVPQPSVPQPPAPVPTPPAPPQVQVPVVIVPRPPAPPSPRNPVVDWAKYSGTDARSFEVLAGTLPVPDSIYKLVDPDLSADFRVVVYGEKVNRDTLNDIANDLPKILWNTPVNAIEGMVNMLSGAFPGQPDYNPILKEFKIPYDTSVSDYLEFGLGLLAGRGISSVIPEKVVVTKEPAGWPGKGGSGPVPGTIGITDETAVGALKNYNPKGDGIEFVYDPFTDTFVTGKPARGLFDGSPHEQLAQSIGAGDKPVVGGTMSRGENGEFFTTENSGHYGQNWNDSIRDQFEAWLSDRLGVPVKHRNWGK